MVKLKGLMATALTAAALCVMPLPSLAQQPVVAGSTDVGVLYLDASSVQTVKKDGVFYLAFFAEEKYTDAEFLAALRQGEDLENAASCISLYLFNNRGSEYHIGASYIVDAAGNVCADLRASMTPVQVGGDKTLRNAYTMALKLLERQRR